TLAMSASETQVPVRSSSTTSPAASFTGLPSSSEYSSNSARTIGMASTTAAIGEARIRIPDDAAVAQRGLQIGITVLGDERVIEIERFQFRPLAQLRRGLVGDVRAVQAQVAQLGERGQTRQAGVGDFGIVQAESGQVHQPAQRYQSRVGNPSPHQVKRA